MNALQKLILGAAAILFAAGTVLAVAKPGDLGDDDVESAQDGTGATSTTVDEPGTSEPSTTTEGPSTTADGTEPTTLTTTTGTPTTAASTTVAPTTTVAPSTTMAPTTTRGTTSTTAAGAGATSTTAGSGLGVGGAGSVNPDGRISDTGGESMIGLGAALLAVGLVLRRATRVQRA